jgi:hypothetical protein
MKVKGCVCCVMVCHLGAPPLIFIDVSKGCFGQQTRGVHLEPTLRSNGEAPRAGGKAVAPKLVRPNQDNRLWPPPLAGTLVSGPSGPRSMSWCCPKSVAFSGVPFDPWEAE